MRATSRFDAPVHKAIWIFVALGCGLRLTGLEVHSLWYDEGATLHVATASDPFLTLHGDRHPPLSFLAFGQWLRWFGASDLALRLLPALVSCLSLVGFALLARRWLATPAAVLAVALQATSAFAIWYGQEVRMYAMVECASVVALTGLAMLADGQRRLGFSAIVVGTNVALGCHYFGGTVAAQVAAAAFFFPAGQTLRRRAWLAAALGVLPWLPWMVSAIPDQMATPWGFQARLSAADVIQLPVRFLLVQLSELPRALVYVVAGLVWLGLARTAAAASREMLARRLLTLVAVPVLLSLGLALLAPASFAPNYLIAAAPFCVLAVAHGLWLLPRWLRGVALALPIAALSATVLLRQHNLREDYRAACAELRAQHRAGDRIVSITGTPEDFSRATVQHYLRTLPSLAADLIDPAQAIALLQDPSFRGRIHAVWRAAEYALPLFDALRAAGTVTHSGEVRQRVQHLVLEPRR